MRRGTMRKRKHDPTPTSLWPRYSEAACARLASGIIYLAAVPDRDAATPLCRRAASIPGTVCPVTGMRHYAAVIEHVQNSREGRGHGDYKYQSDGRMLRSYVFAAQCSVFQSM